MVTAQNFLSRIEHLSSPSFLTSVHACHFFPFYFLYFSLVRSSSSLCCHLNPSFCFLVFFFSAFLCTVCISVLISPPHSQHNCFSTVCACVGASLQACMCFTKKKLLCFFANLSEPEIKFQSLFRANLAAFRSYFCIGHLN